MNFVICVGGIFQDWEQQWGVAEAEWHPARADPNYEQQNGWKIGPSSQWEHGKHRYDGREQISGADPWSFKVRILVQFLLCSYPFTSLLMQFDWFAYFALKSSVPLSCSNHRCFFTSKLGRFVRREKQIAESRFEIAQEETLRYRLRAENLERELSEVQDSMKASRARMEVCVTVLISSTVIFAAPPFISK